MKAIAEVTVETILISIINIFVVYLAAFTYKLNWMGVLTVMVLASLLTASITHIVLSKMTSLKKYTDYMISDGLSVLTVTLLSSLAVLFILTERFNLPEALGISLLSGLLSSLARHLL